MTDTEQNAPALPGLDIPPRPPSQLEAAVRRTVAELSKKDQILEEHALELQLMLSLAQIITDKTTSRKTSTVSNDARLLWEIRNSFAEAETDADERLKAAMDAFNATLDTEAAG